MGIGPTQSAWKADILPLNYTRVFRSARLDAHKKLSINSMLENISIICRRCQEFLHNRTQIIKNLLVVMQHYPANCLKHDGRKAKLSLVARQTL